MKVTRRKFVGSLFGAIAASVVAPRVLLGNDDTEVVAEWQIIEDFLKASPDNRICVEMWTGDILNMDPHPVSGSYADKDEKYSFPRISKRSKIKLANAFWFKEGGKVWK